MRQQLRLLLKFILLTTVTIKIKGSIFYNEEDGSTFSDTLEIRGEVLNFVPRNEWTTLAMTEPIKKLNATVPYVMIYHTGTETCFYRKSCDKLVQNLQAKYISTLFLHRDIGYNFLISGDGMVYIGRGWKIVGAHTIGINEKSIGIGLIGTFYDKSPSIDQFFALKNLIKFGICYRYINSQFKYYSEPDMGLPIDFKQKILNIHQVIENEMV